MLPLASADGGLQRVRRIHTLQQGNAFHAMLIR